MNKRITFALLGLSCLVGWQTPGFASDYSTDLVTKGASQTLTSSGSTTAVAGSFGGNVAGICVVSFTTLVAVCRLYVEASYDGGTNYKKIGVGSNYKVAALASTESDSAVAAAAAGYDITEVLDFVGGSATGRMRIPFFLEGRATHLRLTAVQSGTTPSIVITHAVLEMGS